MFVIFSRQNGATGRSDFFGAFWWLTRILRHFEIAFEVTILLKQIRKLITHNSISTKFSLLSPLQHNLNQDFVFKNKSSVTPLYPKLFNGF